MISNRNNKPKDLDKTVHSDLSDLEKTLIQVRSLRYQMYSKFLSEKLFYEKKLRCLENEKNSSNVLIKDRASQSDFVLKSTQRSSCGGPLQEININDLYVERSTRSGRTECIYEDKNRLYDEKLFNIVEQLETLSDF
jgi:hypothetical protein